MRLVISLAEYATAHADGTYTVVRDGIRVVNTKSDKASLNLKIICRLEGDAAEHGPHTLRLSIRDLDGKPVAGEVSAQLNAPQITGGGAIFLDMRIELPVGEYSLVAVLDQHVADRWPLAIRKRAPRPTPPPPPTTPPQP